MPLYVGVDPGLDNLGLTFYENGVAEAHKIAPFTVSSPKGFKSVSFEERFAIGFAIGLAQKYRARFERATMIGVEQQFKKQKLLVVSLTMWSVLRALFPKTPVVKVLPRDWRTSFELVHTDYGTRKAMSADYMESMVTPENWAKMQAEYKIPANGKKNVDAIESTLIAMYLEDNYDLMMQRYERAPSVKRSKKIVDPDVCLTFPVDRSKAVVPKPRAAPVRRNKALEPKPRKPKTKKPSASPKKTKPKRKTAEPKRKASGKPKAAAPKPKKPKLVDLTG